MAGQCPYVSALSSLIRGVSERFGSSSVPNHPWTKHPAFRLPTPGDSRRPGQREKNARGERLQASGQDAVRAARPSPPQPGCSRACTRAAVLQSAGRAAPVAPHPRAWVSVPSASRWRRRDLRNAPPSPHSQPPWRLRRSLRDPAPPLRTVLPRTLAAVARRPHLRAGSSAHLVLCVAGVRLLLGGGSFVRRPPPPERCTGGRSRGSSTLLETLLQLAFCTVPSFTGQQALPCRILSGPLAHINAHLHTHLIAARPGPEFSSSPTPRSNIPAVADSNVRGWHLRAR